MEYVWLIVGFVLLIKGADFFVDGSSDIAKFFKVPSIIIGLTIVAFGTSMPEASVSINAAIAGANDIAVSNVLGSNIFNLLVVLGASALLCPVKVHSGSVKKEFPFSILITVVLAVLLAVGYTAVTPVASETSIFDNIASGNAAFVLGRIGGIVLLALFAFYMFWQIRDALKARQEDNSTEQEHISIVKAIIMIVGGAVAIIFGGNLVVDSAKTIASNFGMSDTLIGLTIVAIGTSLPELVTSMVAARKGESDIALGNVIGSNIFNIIFILGISSAILPITVDILALYDTLILIAVSIVCLIFARTKHKVSRVEGLIMVLMYVAYSAYIIIR